MKRIISAAVGLITFLSCFTFTAAATNEANTKDIKLPFELEAPKNVSIKFLEGNDSPNTCELVYSQNNSMSEYFSKIDDPETHDAAVEEMTKQGFEDIFIQTQMDWSIDSSDDWHYNKYWDTEGYDEKYVQRLGDWAYISLTYSPEQTNSAWVFRDMGNINDPEDRTWHGSHNDSEDYLGWKDVLKEGQYDVLKNDEGESYASIDFTKHTIHVRVRYLAVVRMLNEENETISVPIGSKWSEEVLVGKDAQKVSALKKGDIDPPMIKDFRMTDEEFNGKPIVAFKLEVPEKLTEQLTQVTAQNNGSITLETECRIKGTDEWKLMQGDWTIKSGEMKVTLLGLTEQDKVITKDTPVELRCRYNCSQNDQETFYSDYSEILTFATKEIDGRTESLIESSNETSGEKTEESKIKEESKSEKKCSVCGICPVQPLGICLFIWIAIIIAVIIVIVVVILIENKKKSEK